MLTASVSCSSNRTICLCNTHAAWGGGEKWHLEAAKALVIRGWHVTLLANPACRLYDEAIRFAEEVIESQNIGSLRVIPLKIKSLSFLNPCTMAHLVRFFRQEKVQTLLLGLPAEVKSVAVAAKMAGVPRIIYRRGSAFATRNSWSNRYLYSSVLTALIVNSKQMQEHNAAIMPAERIHLLANGIDHHIFDSQLNIAMPCAISVQRRFVLGNAARLSPEKGQHYLIRMMADIKAMTEGFGCGGDEISYYDIQLLIAGDGELRAELEALAHELGVHDHITFLGFQNGLYSFWKTINIFVFSSLREGLPNVLAESMMANTPIVAFGVSSIPELVHHGQTGILVMGPPEAMSTGRADKCAESEQTTCTQTHGDTTPSSRLATAVLGLLQNEPVLEHVRRSGRDYAMSMFSQDVCMDRLEQILLI